MTMQHTDEPNPTLQSAPGSALKRKQSWWHHSLARRISSFVKEDLDSVVKRSTFLQQPARPHALLARHEIVTGLQIGKGGFAHVYEIVAFELDPEVDARLNRAEQEARQELAANCLSAAGQSRYALKHLQPSLYGTTKKQAKDFAHAASDLAVEGTFLSRIDHEHILKLRALPVDGVDALSTGTHDAYFLVLDKLDGTLDHKLLQWKRQQQHSRSSSLDIKLDYALQLSRALEYLHSHRILYRDLKPHNIGIKDGKIVLMDFGLVREFPANVCMKEVYQMSGVGTRRYMAPEIVVKSKYNHKADVYSWSMVLWEMLSLERPYAPYSVEEHKSIVCLGGERPSLDYDAWPASVCTLLTACWVEKVADRLDMQECALLLDSILEARKCYVSPTTAATTIVPLADEIEVIEEDDVMTSVALALGFGPENDLPVSPRHKKPLLRPFSTDSFSLLSLGAQGDDEESDNNDSALSNEDWILKHAGSLLMLHDDSTSSSSRFQMGDWSVSTAGSTSGRLEFHMIPQPTPIQFSCTV